MSNNEFECEALGNQNDETGDDLSQGAAADPPPVQRMVISHRLAPREVYIRNWTADNIEIRHCMKYVGVGGDQVDSSSDAEETCVCGKTKSRHQKDALKDHTTGDKWSKFTHTQALPTFAFGKVEFPQYQFKYAMYTLMDIDTDVDKIKEMFSTVWKLDKPNMLLSVLGNADMKWELGFAADRLGGWLISDALRRGRDFPTEEMVASKRVSMGITKWQHVSGTDVLTNDQSNTGCWPASYLFQDSCPPGKFHLDPAHNLYIFTAGENVNVPYDKCRCRFADKIAKSLGVPHLLILNGDCSTELILEALLLNIPIVMVEGSGELAKLFSNIIEIVKEKESEIKRILLIRQYSQKDKQNLAQAYSQQAGRELMDEENVKKILLDTFGVTDVENGAAMVRLCLEKSHLLTIYTITEEQEPYRNITRTLISAVFKAGDEDKLKDLMLYALLSDDVSLVEMLLDLGLLMDNFLTTESLVYLYNKIPKTVILNHLIKLYRAKSRLNTLYNVGLIIKDLIGDTFFPYYLDSQYYDMDVGSMIENVHKITFGDNTDGYIDDDGKENLVQRGDMLPKLHPAHDLFLWAVLVNRLEMAKMFWIREKEHMAWALIAASVLEKMSKLSSDSETKTALKQGATQFNTFALGILQHLHVANKHKTQDLLVRQLESWGGTSVIFIAADTENQAFMAHIACQSMCLRIFRGKLKQGNGLVKLLFCIFCPVAVPLLINFQEETIKKKSDHSDIITLDAGERLKSVRKDTKLDVEIKQTTFCQKIKYFYSSRMVILLLNAMAFFSYLTLYAYVILTEMAYKQVTAAEVILHICSIILYVDELRQMAYASGKSIIEKIKHHFSFFWNRCDLLCGIIFIIGISLRFSSNVDNYEGGRILLCLNFLLGTVRTLYVYSLHKQLGPKLAMIREMIRDMVYFMLIMFVFVCGFGITAEAILRENVELNWKFFLFDLFRRPYFHIYGELFLEDFEAQSCDPAGANGTTCSSQAGKYIAVYLLGIYMLLSNVLLLNLLIAMFSTTYQIILDRTDEHWNYQRFFLVYEYCSKPPLPPPFVVLCYVYYAVRKLLQTIGCIGIQHEISKFKREIKPLDYAQRLALWEKKEVDKYLQKINEEKEDSLEVQVSAVSDKLALLFEKLDRLDRRLENLEN